jgi:hypothetical protein
MVKEIQGFTYIIVDTVYAREYQSIVNHDDFPWSGKLGFILDW